MRVEPIDSGTPLFEAVRRLYRRHTKTLGFMPEGGFTTRASKGSLVVALDDDDVLAGYGLYDLPGRHVALRQLCVDDHFRGQGVARSIVEFIAVRHSERLGISLACRNDYEASKLWPRLDFEPRTERAGRGVTASPLTTWWRDFGHPTLFSPDVAFQPQLLAALDTDVTLDLIGDRASAESRHLTSAWLYDVVELFITKEVSIELANAPDAATRRRHRARLASMTKRDAPSAESERLRRRVAAALGERALSREHDERDVRHVARAAAAGANYFVTRDSDLIRRLAEIAEREFDLAIVSPGELVRRLAVSSGVTYAPVQLENTAFLIQDGANFPIDELVRRFINTSDGERAGHLAQLLREAMADPETRVTVITDEEGAPVSLFSHRVMDDELDIGALRVAGPHGVTIGRQVAHLQRRAAIDLQLQVVALRDRFVPAAVVTGLRLEGFVECSWGWLATPIMRVAELSVAIETLEQTARANPQHAYASAQPLLAGPIAPSLADDLERQHAPLKILGTGITTYMVPIRAAWAAQLFDTALSEETLFNRDSGLGLAREHVYYSGAIRHMELPARILWYVSGHRGHAIRAVSRLDEAVVDRPLTLHRRYQHLGVWGRDQILGVAKKRGRALALRFSDTEQFAFPVSLEHLRTIASDFGHTLVLRSPCVVPEHMFAQIYLRGHNGPPSSSIISLAEGALRGSDPERHQVR